MRRVRTLVWAAAFVLAVTGCGPDSGSGILPAGGASAGDAAASSPDSGPGGQTFGSQPCGKLVSFQEIAAATGDTPTLVDVVADGECQYEDDAGFAVLTVITVTDPAGHPACTASDGTYLGGPVEPVSGIGDTAIWSPKAGSLCFVKGDHRVQISLSTNVDDPKAVSTDLATKAVQRT